MSGNELYWRGKPIEDFSREELLEIVKQLHANSQRTDETVGKLIQLIHLREYRR